MAGLLGTTAPRGSFRGSGGPDHPHIDIHRIAGRPGTGLLYTEGAQSVQGGRHLEASEGRHVAHAPSVEGVEPLVAEDLRALGLPAKALHAGVATEGTLSDVQRLNLELACAQRVLVR